MIRAGVCALAVLLLAGTAAGAPAGRDPVATIQKAIKAEELAIQELKFRHVAAAERQLNESRVLLAGVAAHASPEVAKHLRNAENDDEIAIRYSHEAGHLGLTVQLVEAAIKNKRKALAALAKQPSGLGCIGLLSESKKFPGETEIMIRGCDQDVSAIELTYPVKVKSTSQAASISPKIGGGYAVSKCIEPSPTTISCGGYPTFLPAEGTFLLDVLPHLKSGQQVTATVHGKTLTVTLTITQH